MSARVPAGIPAGGQFAATARAEASVDLSDINPGCAACHGAMRPEHMSPPLQAAHAEHLRSTAGRAEVQDSSGHNVQVTLGVLDESADWVYTNGQCLALAVALSERTGWPVHLRTIATVGEMPDIRHAYVQAPDGTLVDIRGEHDADIIDEECRDLDGDLYLSPRTVPAEHAASLLQAYENGLEHQDVAVARSFAEPVLARAGFEGERI